MPINHEVVYGNMLEKNAPPPDALKSVIRIQGEFRGQKSAFGISEEVLSKHILLVGGTGSGKTNLFYHMVRQLKAKMTADDVMLAVCICVLYNRFCTRKSPALLACLSFGFAILFTFLVFLLNNWWRYLYENTRFYWNFQNGWYWPFSAVLKSDIKYSIGIGKYRYWLVFFAAEIGLLVEMVSMREVSKKSKPSI